MLTEITLTSTSDTEEQVREAMNLPPTPPVDLTAPPASTTDAPPADTPPAADPAPPVVPVAAADEDDDDDDDFDEPPVDAAASEAGRTLGARGRSAKARIDKLRAKLTDAQEANKTLIQQLRNVKPPEPEAVAGLPPAAAPAAAAPADAPPAPPAAPEFTKARPAQEDFDDFDKFQEAREAWVLEKADFMAEQKIAAADARRAAEARAEREAAAQDAVIKARVEPVRAKHADYDEVTQAAKDLPVSLVMRDHLRASEAGPELYYHFATHPEEAEAIAKLPPGPALVALGRLEARLEAQAAAPPAAEPVAPVAPAVPAAPAAPRVPVSRAPAPTGRVGGTVTPPAKPVEEMSHEEYKAARKAGFGR